MDNTPSVCFVNAASDVGIQFMAAVVSFFLWGITSMQLFLYLLYHHHRDSRLVKATAVWVWCMDTCHQIFTAKGLFFQLVTNFGNTAVLRALSTDWVIESIFIPLVSLPTQLYFTHRIWQFSGKNWIYPIVFVPMSIFHLAGRIAFTVLSLRAPEGADGPAVIHSMEQLQVAFWAIAAAEDILISVILIVSIWKRRPGDEVKSTRSLIRKLILLSINTGVWTALDALFTIILLAAYPTKFFFAALVFVQAPLYANSLLANLNARSFIRGTRSANRSGFTEPDNVIELGENMQFESPDNSTNVGKGHTIGSFQPSNRSKVSEATSGTYALA